MDSIGNMLIALKNAGNAGHNRVVIPFSKLRLAIAECLQKEGYLAKVEKRVRKNFPVLEVEVAYIGEKNPRITDVARVSKPSRRMYAGMRDIYTVRNGKGRLILSTPKGIMSGNQAKKEQVGGELLFEIW